MDVRIHPFPNFDGGLINAKMSRQDGKMKQNATRKGNFIIITRDTR